ncbi:MAG: hypothetical protein NVSMB30_23520 [Hymenobacter sp.]
MRLGSFFGAWGLVLALGGSAQAQQLNNDGFQRRNGQMQVVRNGQGRAMTRDVHLPTGATVTKDGFVVSATGQRTELREGEGCDLRGRPVTVLTAPDGTLALDAPVPLARPNSRSEAPPARSLLEELFGQGNGDDKDEGRLFKFKKSKKGHGKGRFRW